MGRSVLVTGGNRGIGRAIATAFADAGDNVAVTYRSGEPPPGVLAVKCDVTQAGDVEAATKAARVANRQLDKAASKGVIHKNQAANRKSAISKKLNSLAA